MTTYNILHIIKLIKDEREIDKKLNCDLFSNNTRKVDYRGQKFLDDLIENKFNYIFNYM